MNTNHLLSAIGHANDQYKQEVIDHMNNQKTGRYQARPVRRTLRLIPAAAAIICLLAVTAYAAVNYWGIFDFQRGTPQSLPTEAQELVHQQDETGSNEIVTCKVTESLNDGQKLYLTVRMQSAQPGKYALLFQMDEPTMDASYFGADSDGTLEAYCKENNMTMMMVGCTMKPLGGGGSGVQSIQEKHQSPDTMDFLITCDIADIGSDTEGIFSYVVHELDAAMGDEFRGEIPITFPKAKKSAENVYHPVSQPAVDGMTVGDVTVTQTDLMTYFDIDLEMSEEMMTQGMRTLRIRHGDTFDSAYGILGDDGQWHWRIESSKMEVGDSFTLELFDPGDDTFTGEIEFTK